MTEGIQELERLIEAPVATEEPLAERPDRTEFGLTVLAVSLLLGVLGHTLLKAQPWGINVPLWLGSALLGVLAVSGRFGAIRGEGRWLALPAFAFAALLAWRDSGTLTGFALLALLVSLALGMEHAQEGALSRSGLVSYFFTLFMSGIYALVQPLELLFGDIRWRSMARHRNSALLLSLLRGLVLAVPLLLLFGVLLVAADALFARVIGDLIDLDVVRLFTTVIGTLFWTWLLMVLMRTAILHRHTATEPGEAPGALRLGSIEVGLVLGLLNLLFLAFIVVQAGYFFGGERLISSDPQLGYAEYARRGFFELVTVAALVVALLLVLHWLTRRDQARTVRLFRLLAAGMIVLLFVIMASALHRMWLYQRAYGLTELRLYTTAFMGWLAFLFLWFGGTVLRGERRRFAIGALASAFAALLLLALLNPDALIARVNLARGPVPTEAQSVREVDAAYLSRLSAAAVPPLVAQIDTLSPDAACESATRLLQRWGTPIADWRTWNWDRWQATRAVAAARPHLEEIACPITDDYWMD